MELRARSFREAYRDIVDLVMHGSLVHSRVGATCEILGLELVFDDPRECLVTLPERRLNPYLIIGEWIWFLSARNDLDTVMYYNQYWKKCSDDGVTLNGAYGARMFAYNGATRGIDQFLAAANELKRDRNSRRALIHLHAPEDLLKPSSKDIPCNSLLQFLIRNDKLHLFVYCRSNDTIKGLSNDVPHFSLFQMLMATHLGLEIGTYRMYIASQHIYETDFALAREIVESPRHSSAWSIENRIRFPLYGPEMDLQSFTDALVRAADDIRHDPKPDYLAWVRASRNSTFMDDAIALLLMLNLIKKEEFGSASDLLLQVSPSNTFRLFMERSVNRKAIR